MTLILKLETYLRCISHEFSVHSFPFPKNLRMHLPTSFWQAFFWFFPLLPIEGNFAGTALL